MRQRVVLLLVSISAQVSFDPIAWSWGSIRLPYPYWFMARSPRGTSSLRTYGRQRLQRRPLQRRRVERAVLDLREPAVRQAAAGVAKMTLRRAERRGADWPRAIRRHSDGRNGAASASPPALRQQEPAVHGVSSRTRSGTLRTASARPAGRRSGYPSGVMSAASALDHAGVQRVAARGRRRRRPRPRVRSLRTWTERRELRHQLGRDRAPCTAAPSMTTIAATVSMGAPCPPRWSASGRDVVRLQHEAGRVDVGPVTGRAHWPPRSTPRCARGWSSSPLVGGITSG